MTKCCEKCVCDDNYFQGGDTHCARPECSCHSPSPEKNCSARCINHQGAIFYTDGKHDCSCHPPKPSGEEKHECHWKPEHRAKDCPEEDFLGITATTPSSRGQDLEDEGWYRQLDDVEKKLVKSFIQKEIEAAEKRVEERAFSVNGQMSQAALWFERGRAEGKSLCLKEIVDILDAKIDEFNKEETVLVAAVLTNLKIRLSSKLQEEK